MAQERDHDVHLRVAGRGVAACGVDRLEDQGALGHAEPGAAELLWDQRRQVAGPREYPEKFVKELTQAGYLAALIPQEFGGAGLGIFEGGLILETINYSGGNAGACHAQMYIMGTVLRHGSEAQKREYLPKIATGALRLQAFGVTERNSGSDTTKLQTTAIRAGDRYVVNGQKIFISRMLQSDLMLLLARTAP